MGYNSLPVMDKAFVFLFPYSTSPQRALGKTDSPLIDGDVSTDGQIHSVPHSRNVVSGETSRLFQARPVDRTGRKGKIPGQKLKQVCEILHCKNAAREQQQRRLEASERNCNSAGSSSSGTVASLEEPILVNCEFQPVSLESEVTEIADPHNITQAPFAHSHNNNNQDAVNLRRLLGTKPNRSHSESLHHNVTYHKNTDVEEMVLDLSVCKSRDSRASMADPRNSLLSEEIYDPRRTLNVNSGVLDMVIHGKRDVTMPEVMNRPQVLSHLDIQTHTPIYAYPQIPVTASREESFNTVVMCNTSSELPEVEVPSNIPLVQPDPQVEISAMSRNVAGISRMRTRTRRQVARKTSVNEGMKLINENNLYPGVYTSTFKLPGCRRGRRNTAAKQMSQQLPTTINNVVTSQPTAATGQSNMMIPLQVPNGGQQPYMMLYPQVAVSSVLVKSPRKRGRPPKKPTIAQFQCSTEQQPNLTPVVMPQSQMTISLPTGTNPGIVSSDNGAVSYLYQPQAEQSSVNLPQQVLQQPLMSGSTSTSVHPNHNQLVSILNQATSINACNPVFVPNSSLQQGIPTALPTNASGIITLPLQNVKTEDQPGAQGAPRSLVSSPTFVTQDLCQEQAKMSPSNEASSPESPGPSTSAQGKVTDLNTTTTLSPNSGVFQEMILSPQALVNVKPRSKPTTTELIRSNSNFYCGSFKIRPQKPNTQLGQGTPLKRGRGRPRLNVFESSRQKETKESRSKMYQELFHCKVCNEIVSAGERLSHQRKHVAVKIVCHTCGIEFQSYKNLANLSKDMPNPPCPECKKMYEYEMNHRVQSAGEGVDGEDFEAMDKVFSSHQDVQGEDAQTPDTQLVCQICGNVSHSSAEYAHHLTEHQDDAFVCSEEGCCQRFRNGSELRRHVKYTHVKGKEHPCVYEGCDKKFMKNFHLQEHIRVKHFNIKAFKCPWPNCQKEFAGIRHLKVHMLIHKGEKPLKCDFCDYRCRQRNALNWHMRKHTEVSSQCKDGLLGSESDPDNDGMEIDMGISGADSVSDELSPKGYEPENEDVDSSPDSFSDFSPVNDDNHISAE